MEFVDEEKNLAEPAADVSEAFLNQVTSKCAKYRSAVEKDKAKKSTLVQQLQKDFGDKILEEIEIRKKSVNEEDAVNTEEVVGQNVDVEETIKEMV